MRRAGGLWPRIRSFDALWRATRRAARGKRRTAAAARFLERAEFHVLDLERALKGGSWRPGPVDRFAIEDPKPRIITAVPFRDRVVHHALMGELAPVLERRMIDDSFACRIGKGTHAALGRARALVRRHDWFLKLDVRSFFASVSHDVVRETLARCVKDREALHLCDVILRGPLDEPPTTTGLPIGSLTSQWFANAVLDRLDHFVKEGLRVPGYLRYMDDFVLFANERALLATSEGAVSEFLRDSLRLTLKEKATRLAPTSSGLPYLAWQIWPGVVRVRPENARRAIRRLRRRRFEWSRGLVPAERLGRSVSSTLAHLAHGNTETLRRRLARACERENDELTDLFLGSEAVAPATAGTWAAASGTTPTTAGRRSGTSTTTRGTATATSASAPPARHAARSPGSTRRPGRSAP